MDQTPKLVISIIVTFALGFTICIAGPMLYSWAFACGTLFMFAANLKKGQRAVAASLGLGLFGLHTLLANARLDRIQEFVLCFGMLGRGCLIVLCWRYIWSPAAEKRERRALVLVPTSIVFFTLASAVFVSLNARRPAPLLDLYLYAFDGSLGFQPSFWMGRLAQGSRVNLELLQVSYTCLPFVIGLICFGHLGRGSSPRVLAALASAGVLGYICYLVFPASGPIYVWASRFPSAPHTLAELRALPLRTLEWAELSPRNAMPSLHAAWAFLLWFYCWPFSRIYRWLAFLFVVLTVLCTLSLGEHYLVDLIVAFPFSVAVYAFWSGAAIRRIALPIVITFALNVSWIAILRYDVSVFFVSAILPWACIVGSTTLSWLAVRRTSDSTTQ